MTARRALGLRILTAGVDSYRPHLRPDGELADPLFGEPTQYGTAYHAYGNAVLALLRPAHERADRLERAVRGIRAALRHTGDPALPATASGFDRATGSVTHRGNHRDFTWPPITKTLALLPRLGADPDTVADLTAQAAAVDPEKSFKTRPPSNWAAVWLRGEWARHRAGLSPWTEQDFDRRLRVFLDQSIDLDLGFFAEPGLPNSYDLFTRLHLAGILTDGYRGAARAELARLMETGLRRSLAVQLADGSLASAHRSTGQSWTVGAQAAYFTLAAGWFTGEGDDPRLAADAARAADRAVRLLGTRQRPDGPFSPVDNLLPPHRRVGYEGYTADAHYASLALAFLADALTDGYGDAPWLAADPDPAADPAPAPAASRTRIEGAPLHRAVAHLGATSVHLDGNPSPAYDTFGLADLVLGPDRHLGFGVARTPAGDARATPGLALRRAPGRQPLEVLSARRHAPATPVETEPGVLRLAAALLDPPPAAPDGTETADEAAGTADDPARRHVLTVRLLPDGVEIEESVTGAAAAWPTLLIPYPVDTGRGGRTAVEILPGGVRLRLGAEAVDITLLDTDPADTVVLPGGWEGRRGDHGLVRLDLPTPGTTLRYRITATR